MVAHTGPWTTWSFASTAKGLVVVARSAWSSTAPDSKTWCALSNALCESRKHAGLADNYAGLAIGPTLPALAEAGLRVTVVAADPPERTTSMADVRRR